MGKCDEVIVDEIEFYNAGNYANPEPGVRMKGRSKKDLHTVCIARGRGVKVEDLQDRIENEIDIGFEEKKKFGPPGYAHSVIKPKGEPVEVVGYE